MNIAAERILAVRVQTDKIRGECYTIDFLPGRSGQKCLEAYLQEVVKNGGYRNCADLFLAYRMGRTQNYGQRQKFVSFYVRRRRWLRSGR